MSAPAEFLAVRAKKLGAVGRSEIGANVVRRYGFRKEARLGILSSHGTTAEILGWVRGL
jgi:hypothetical protein